MVHFYLLLFYDQESCIHANLIVHFFFNLNFVDCDYKHALTLIYEYVQVLSFLLCNEILQLHNLKTFLLKLL
jgi:hypothetical protein